MEKIQHPTSRTLIHLPQYITDTDVQIPSTHGHITATFLGASGELELQGGRVCKLADTLTDT